MSNPVRVLHVFAGLNCGGAENLVMNLYRHIDRAQIQFDFAYYKRFSDYFVREIQEMGGQVYRLPPPTFRHFFSFLFRWWRILSKQNTHRIIHGHAQATSIVYLFFARLMRRHTILHAHTTHHGYGGKGLARRIFQFPARFFAHTRLACSQEAGEWLFGKKKAFSIFSNAIDLDRFRYDPDEAKRQKEQLGMDGKLVIGHVGRFSREKNHAFLLEVFGQFLARNPESVLFLVGDGPLKHPIAERAKEQGLEDHVVFAGFIPDVGRLMMAMDLFVLPSLYEGVPLTLIEAQSSGLPCLVSDAISLDVIPTSLVHTLSLRENEQVWADKMVEIANRPHQQDRSHWHLSFRDTEFDIRIQAIKYERLIREPIGNQRKGNR